MKTIALFLLLLLNCGFVFADPFYIIGTGKGVVTVVQTGSSFVLKEESWRGINETFQQWQIKKDTSFSNGFFYHHQNDMSLVWNIKTANTGVPVTLASKQNTLITTKNQRWVNSSSTNQIASILNEIMTININSSGHLVMAQKAVTTQKFYPIKQEELLKVIVYNRRKNEQVFAFISSPLIGNVTNITIPAESETPVYTTYGSKLIVKDGNGTILSNWVNITYGNWGFFIYAVPVSVPVDVSISVEGDFTTTEGQNYLPPFPSPASLIFTKYSYSTNPPFMYYVTGFGSDTYGGYTVGGEVRTERFDLWKNYEDGYYHSLRGLFYYDSNNILTLNGTWDWLTEWDDQGWGGGGLLAKGTFFWQQI